MVQRIIENHGSGLIGSGCRNMRHCFGVAQLDRVALISRRLDERVVLAVAYEIRGDLSWSALCRVGADQHPRVRDDLGESLVESSNGDLSPSARHGDERWEKSLKHYSCGEFIGRSSFYEEEEIAVGN